jgi:hypothetical protein
MLTPLGAPRLIGFPLAEAGGRLIDPADLFGSAARETIERLQETNSHAVPTSDLKATDDAAIDPHRNQIRTT